MKHAHASPYPTERSWRMYMPNAVELPPAGICPVVAFREDPPGDRRGVVISGPDQIERLINNEDAGYFLNPAWCADIDTRAGFVLTLTDAVMHWGSDRVKAALRAVAVQPAARQQIITLTRLTRCLWGETMIQPADRHALAQALAHLVRT